MGSFQFNLLLSDFKGDPNHLSPGHKKWSHTSMEEIGWSETLILKNIESTYHNPMVVQDFSLFPLENTWEKSGR
jgi:hypothetical protein